LVFGDGYHPLVFVSLSSRNAGFACKISGGNFTDASSLDIGFAACLLVNASLRQMSFRKMVLREVDFSDADLTEADFRDASFEKCSLREATLKLAKFAGADLRGCDLGPVELSAAGLFKGAVISREQASELLRGFGLKVM